MTRILLYATSALMLMAAAGRSHRDWQPHSLTPVQQFGRLSEASDLDEGTYALYDSFLSKGFSANHPLGAPGKDAPPQPMRRHPYGVALSEDEQKLYVTAPGNEAEPGSSVLVIETQTGAILREIPVGSHPLGITSSPSLRHMVVTNQYSNYLSVIDTQSDTEVLRIPSYYYAQKIAFVPDRGWMLVTNRAMDSVDVYSFQENPLHSSFRFRIGVSVDNFPFRLDDDPGYGLGGDHQTQIGPAPGFSNTDVATPRDLVRHLTNVNPRDLVVAGNRVYVANVNGLGISILDLDARRQVASIDLNAPALDVLALGPYVFISTMGRFIQGFDDVHNEIAVVDTRHDPFKLRMRYTSAALPPYGPQLGPGRGPLMPATGKAPYMSAFGVANFAKTPTNRNVFLQILDGFQTNPDNLPAIVDGALPDQMIELQGGLLVADSASDELELFAVDTEVNDPTQILKARAHAFTNASQTAFPEAIDKRSLTDNGRYLSGKDDPNYFQGRMPQEMAFGRKSGRLYVANRLGEAVAVFNVDQGTPVFERLIDLTLPDLPPFPATLAEVGEDFYTASRVSLNRDIACLSCHPDLNVDTKLWHVGSTPGRSARLTLTNRNLRDTPPYYRSAIRRNLEDFRGTFRVMSPEGPFGFFEIPAPFDANGDGVLNDADRGRTVADVNRNRMFALERTGVGFEKTSAAIAAFLEAEMRQLPNPFLTRDRELSTSVPVMTDLSGRPIRGDAVEGRRLFFAAGCAACHPAPVFTTNEVLSVENGRMADVDGDNIPDGVTLSIERTLFDRLPSPWEQYRPALPRERLPFTGIDTDPRLHFANTANTFTPPGEMKIPYSPFSGRQLIGATSDTRNVNIPSLRGVWDLPAMLQHGRATDVLSVLTTFNDIGRHGDKSVFGMFDVLSRRYDINSIHLAAFLKSIE